MTIPIREEILQEARTWLRTPYHHAACVKGQGVDCAWYLIGVFRNVGLLPAEFHPGQYSPDWSLHRNEERFLNLVSRHAERVSEPQPGDIALYRHGRCVGHGAIVEQWPIIIHATEALKMVARDDSSLGMLPRRLYGFFSPVRS